MVCQPHRGSKVEKNYINLERCQPGKIHRVWDLPSTDPIIVHRASIHAKVMVQRYPIYTCKISRSQTETCPCCDSEPETMVHFLLLCKTLQVAREKELTNITNLLTQNNLVPTQNTLLYAILDPSHLSNDEDLILNATNTARTLVFNLHLCRLRILSGAERTRLNSAVMIKRTRTILTYRPVPAPQPAPTRTGAPQNGREIKDK